jgi:hypothetical protein
MKRRSGAKRARGDDAEQSIVPQSHLPDMTVDEAIEAYTDQWIFLEVTERDQKDAPRRGRVLDHHPHRSGIQPTVMKVIEQVKASPEAPEGVRGYYIFYGVRLFRTAAAWEEYKRQTGLFGGGRGVSRQ